MPGAAAHANIAASGWISVGGGVSETLELLRNLGNPSNRYRWRIDPAQPGMADPALWDEPVGPRATARELLDAGLVGSDPFLIDPGLALELWQKCYDMSLTSRVMEHLPPGHAREVARMCVTLAMQTDRFENRHPDFPKHVLCEAYFMVFLWSYDHFFDSRRPQIVALGGAPLVKAANAYLRVCYDGCSASEIDESFGRFDATLASLLRDYKPSRALWTYADMNHFARVVSQLIRSRGTSLSDLHAMRDEIGLGQGEPGSHWFRQSLSEHIESREREVTRRPDSMEEYRELRRRTGAVQACEELWLECRARRDRDPEMMARIEELRTSEKTAALVTKIMDAANLHVCWMNDLASWNKDIEDCENNAVKVFLNTNAPAPDQDCEDPEHGRLLSIFDGSPTLSTLKSREVRLAAHNVLLQTREFVDTIERAWQRLHTITTRPELAHLLGAANVLAEVAVGWMLGNLDWSFQTPRYFETADELITLLQEHLDMRASGCEVDDIDHEGGLAA